jgi:hypothetical protein
MKLEGRWRLLSGVALAALFALGAWLSTGEPRLTVLNDSLRISYPWARGLGALLAGASLAAIAWCFAKPWVRVVAAILGVISFGVAIHLLSYRLDATEAALSSRVFFMRTEIAWPEVLHVGTDPTLMVVRGEGERRISIDTTDFSPEQRLVLSRTITRRLTEASRSASSR